jgi:hypothetical protein
LDKSEFTLAEQVGEARNDLIGRVDRVCRLVGIFNIEERGFAKPRPSVIVAVCSEGLVIRGSLNFGAACTGVHAGLAVPVVYHALASNSNKEVRGEAGEIIGGITDEVVARAVDRG